jgi:hypothetical protein
MARLNNPTALDARLEFPAPEYSTRAFSGRGGRDFHRNCARPGKPESSSIHSVSEIWIESIRIPNRHRRDYGDIGALARSIEEVGLLQPIGITPGGVLLFGERRLRAFQLLGRTRIPAQIVQGIEDAVHALKAERDENVCRKD